MGLISQLLSCGSGHVPAINIKLFAGDSAHDGITRAQVSQTIACNDPAINNYVCMSYPDLSSVYQIIQECKVWPANTPMVSEKKLYQLYKPNLINAKKMFK